MMYVLPVKNIKTFLNYPPKKFKCDKLLYCKAFSFFSQERKAQSRMRRPLEASRAGKATPIRHVPTVLSRCWGDC